MGRPRRLEENLYEYCALAQEMCGFWYDFVGSYGSEGVFFGRHQVFRLGAFQWSSGGQEIFMDFPGFI